MMPQELLKLILSSKLPDRWACAKRIDARGMPQNNQLFLQNLERTTDEAALLADALRDASKVDNDGYNYVMKLVEELRYWLRVIEERKVLKQPYPANEKDQDRIRLEVNRILGSLEQAIVKQYKCSRIQCLDTLWDHINGFQKLGKEIGGMHTWHAFELFCQAVGKTPEELSPKTLPNRCTIVVVDTHLDGRRYKFFKTIFPRHFGKGDVLGAVIRALGNAQIINKRLVFHWMRGGLNLIDEALKNFPDKLRDRQVWIGYDRQTDLWIVFELNPKDGTIGTAYPLDKRLSGYALKDLKTADDIMWLTAQ